LPESEPGQFFKKQNENMKFNLSPLLAIAFILGLIIGNLIPFKFMAGLVVIWILIGIGNSVYKKYFKKY